MEPSEFNLNNSQNYHQLGIYTPKITGDDTTVSANPAQSTLNQIGLTGFAELAALLEDGDESKISHFLTNRITKAEDVDVVSTGQFIQLSWNYPLEQHELVIELIGNNQMTTDFFLFDLWTIEVYNTLATLKVNLNAKYMSKHLKSAYEELDALFVELYIKSLQFAIPTTQELYDVILESHALPTSKDLSKYFITADSLLLLAKKIEEKIHAAKRFQLVTSDNLSEKQLILLRTINSGEKKVAHRAQIHQSLNRLLKLMALYTTTFDVDEEKNFFTRDVYYSKNNSTLASYDVKAHIRILLDYFDFKMKCLQSTHGYFHVAAKVDFTQLKAAAGELRNELSKGHVDMGKFFKFQRALEFVFSAVYSTKQILENNNINFFSHRIDQCRWAKNMAVEKYQEKPLPHFIAYILFMANNADIYTHFCEELLFKINEINLKVFPDRYRHGRWELEQIRSIVQNLFNHQTTLHRRPTEETPSTLNPKSERKRLQKEKHFILPNTLVNSDSVIDDICASLQIFFATSAVSKDFIALAAGQMTSISATRIQIDLLLVLKTLDSAIRSMRKNIIAELHEIKKNFAGIRSISEIEKVNIRIKWNTFIGKIPIEFFDLLYGLSLLKKIQIDGFNQTRTDKYLDDLEISDGIFNLLSPLAEVDQIFPVETKKKQPKAMHKGKGKAKKTAPRKAAMSQSKQAAKAGILERAAAVTVEKEPDFIECYFDSGMKTRSIRTFLEDHGLNLKEIRGDHAKYVNPETGGSVIVPVSKETQKPGTLRSIQKQFFKAMEPTLESSDDESNE